MRTYSEETRIRVAEINPIRSYYETSAQFEMGYVMSEILERYRKLVENLKGPHEKSQRSDQLNYVIKRCEYVQKLYFEIFHLCNMFHEIEKKWELQLKLEAKGPEDALEEGEDLDMDERLRRIELSIEKAKRARERERKRRLKERKNLEKMGNIAERFGKKDYRPVNKWWPLDYGWEIDYYW
ncbi:unnamed protein product [Leptosia nina]|uniref:Uncharacterized protein n=1 Tax=Leptosia nina TaxID=320188 RepID=A0AAV1JUM1_9NEOP